jgi:Sulfotransferase family
MPRSGTTWVGRMLDASNGTTYVDEPLNIWRRPRLLRRRTLGWPGYPYVTADNEDRFGPVLRDLVALELDLVSELVAARTRGELRIAVSTWSTFLAGRARGRRALVKEPHAFFLVPWFVERLGGTAVVTVRHPAAVVSSWKRLRWPVDLDQLLAQPLLVRDWLEPYERELRNLRSSNDIVSQVSLLWAIVYDFVASLPDRLGSLRIVRHEDLSTNPIEGYRELYAALGLSFTDRVEQAVIDASSPSNPKQISVAEPYAVRLDSKANLFNWKERLTADELARVRRLTYEVAARFYEDEWWE